MVPGVSNGSTLRLGPFHPAVRPVVLRLRVPVAKASVVLVSVTLPRGTQPSVVPSSQPFETIVWAVARVATASCSSAMTPTAHAQVHHRCRVAKVSMKGSFPGQNEGDVADDSEGGHSTPDSVSIVAPTLDRPQPSAPS